MIAEVSYLVISFILQRMRQIDGDLKKIQDELNDKKNSLGSVSKSKESPSYLVKDLGDIIYNSDINPDIYFIEKLGSENLTTMIAILHK